MHRHRKLDGAEAGSGMAADARAGFEYELPHLIGDFLKIFDAKLTQVGRRIYFG
jgi:hypothetical protein